MFPKLNGYRKRFYEAKYMSFSVKNEKLLKTTKESVINSEIVLIIKLIASYSTMKNMKWNKVL